MLDKFLALLERFVVAHELIAANSAPRQISTEAIAKVVEARYGDVEKVVKDNKERKVVAADELADDEREEKIKSRTERKPRATKPKAEPEPDLDKLREEIEVMAKHIGSGDSDDCADALDDLLDDYGARSVKKVKDLQVQDFHKEIKAIDIKLLRFEISSMKAALKEAKATDALEDLFEDYKVDSEKALADEQVADFHTELKAIVAKYYDIEE
ncbi:MAG: hypothetical protein ACRCWV_16360 [Raoultella sp.]